MNSNNGRKLGSPYPIKIFKEDEPKVKRAMRRSGLSKPQVLRMSITAGLPIVRRRLLGK